MEDTIEFEDPSPEDSFIYDCEEEWWSILEK